MKSEFLLTLFDDEWVRHKAKALNCLELMFDDHRNQLPDSYYYFSDEIPLGTTIRVTMEVVSPAPVTKTDYKCPAPDGYVQPSEPDRPDGCDYEGFPGGCRRMGCVPPDTTCGYPPLPEAAHVKSTNDSTSPKLRLLDLFTADQMKAYADADRQSRGIHTRPDMS